MAEVTLNIGGRQHVVACRDGEEAHLRSLGDMLEARWPVADRAAGGLSVERAMLFVALMLADSLDEAKAQPAVGSTISEGALARMADRLEAIAAALEESPANA